MMNICPECDSDREKRVREQFHRDRFGHQRYLYREYVECTECDYRYVREFGKHGEFVGAVKKD